MEQSFPEPLASGPRTEITSNQTKPSADRRIPHGGKKMKNFILKVAIQLPFGLHGFSQIFSWNLNSRVQKGQKENAEIVQLAWTEKQS